MLSAFVLLCVLFASKITAISSLPTGTMPTSDSDESDRTYTVVLKSPTQFMKVEVVNDGNAVIRDIEVQGDTIEEEEEGRERRTPRPEHETPGASSLKNECDWRILYNMFLRKHDSRTLGLKRRDVKNAFKVVCSNLDDFLNLLLHIRPGEMDDGLG